MSSVTIPLELAKRILDHLETIQDVGPEGEGWKSDELQADIKELERLVKESDAS